MKINSAFIRTLAVLSLAVTVMSCGRKAAIKGEMEGAAGSEVIVKLLDVNRYTVLDTVCTDRTGAFSYKVDVEKGCPEFIYLFKGDRKVASLLLEAGDKVRVKMDTLGNFAVEGSEESVRLQQVEKEFMEVGARMDRISDDMLAATGKEVASLKKELADAYVSYYRSRVKYVLENSHSLTVVPVFYQQISQGLPVFAQSTDAILFKNVCDSLETVYPESRYVKSLRKEADRRMNLLDLNSRIKRADEVGFPDISLKDIEGKDVKLSDVEGKVVMLHFWSSADPQQKMFNNDVLAPLYKEYHDRGFEIYAVSLDPDKARWANTVRSQNMGWVNVCDIMGQVSANASLYNVTSLPSSFFISDGNLVYSKEPLKDLGSIRNLLDKYLD